MKRLSLIVTLAGLFGLGGPTHARLATVLPKGFQSDQSQPYAQHKPYRVPHSFGLTLVFASPRIPIVPGCHRRRKILARKQICRQILLRAPCFSVLYASVVRYSLAV